MWHFNSRGPDVERLVKGRERVYLDRFWNELSADPKSIDEATRQHYAELYPRPGAAMADDWRFVATDVTSVVIANSGHWLMEEQPVATIAAIGTFLDQK